MLAVIAAAAFLTAIHLSGGKVRFVRYVPRSAWLSFAGGVSVAYVFAHLLPEVARHAEAARLDAAGGASIWLLSLLGVISFYGVETHTRRRRTPPNGRGGGSFWLSIGSYATYNALIAYLLHEERAQGLMALFAFSVAMGLHFVVNDFALRDHHEHAYDSLGRWIVVAGIALGALAGAVLEIPALVIGSIVAFVCGGVVLNVFKEELPGRAQSRFGPFVAGASVYAVLLVAT